MLKGANLMWLWKEKPEVACAVVKDPRLSWTGAGGEDPPLCTPEKVEGGGHCLPIPTLQPLGAAHTHGTSSLHRPASSTGSHRITEVRKDLQDHCVQPSTAKPTLNPVPKYQSCTSVNICRDGALTVWRNMFSLSHGSTPEYQVAEYFIYKTNLKPLLWMILRRPVSRNFKPCRLTGGKYDYFLFIIV